MRTLTLKGLSEQLYTLLKKRAEAEHRSLNRQAILLLEQGLARQTIDVKAWLEETARLRKRWRMKPMTMEEIDAAKKKGRR
jgi:hypothetical protein